MKKFLGIMAIGLMLMASITSKAQDWKYSGPGDTLIASSVAVTPSTPVNTFKDAQVVSVSVTIDSIGGTPHVTAYLQVSNDQIHWQNTGSAIVFTCPGSGTWHTNGALIMNTQGVSDSTVIVNTNPWPAGYLRVRLVATSATQRDKYWVSVKARSTY